MSTLNRSHITNISDRSRALILLSLALIISGLVFLTVRADLQEDQQDGDILTFTTLPVDSNDEPPDPNDDPDPDPEPEPETYTLTTNIDGNGQVHRNPDRSTYPVDSAVTLTAESDGGSAFIEWLGDTSAITQGSVHDQTITIAVSTDTTLTAHFERMSIFRRLFRWLW